MNKFQLWMYKRAPEWIIKEVSFAQQYHADVILSFAPLFGLLAFLYAALRYF